MDDRGGEWSWGRGGRGLVGGMGGGWGWRGDDATIRLKSGS